MLNTCLLYCSCLDYLYALFTSQQRVIFFFLTDTNIIFFITQIFMGFFFQTLSQCSADDACLKVKMMSLH